MSYKIVVNETKLGFTASHFLTEHPTCGTIHGHNYGITVSIEVKESQLDEKYMIVDFNDIKSIVNDLVKDLDHKLLIPQDSSDLDIKVLSDHYEILVKPINKTYKIPLQDIYILPIPATTAECLARFIFKGIQEELKLKNYKMMVRIHENRGYYAEYSE